ncbi:MAG: FeoA family protein [Chloroflexota bacterium]|nr:FeoA family protein [Chloroflexota bacterium]
MANKLQPLSHLSQGSKAIVHHFGGGKNLSKRLLVLGFTKGVEVTVQQNSGFGPVIVLIRDSRIALGRGEAKKVMVEKNNYE